MSSIDDISTDSFSSEKSDCCYPCNCTHCGKDTHGIGWRVLCVCSEFCFRARDGIFYRMRNELDDIIDELGIEIAEENCKVCGKNTKETGWGNMGVCSRKCLYCWKSYGNPRIKKLYDPKENGKDSSEIEMNCFYCGKDATDSGWPGACSRRCAIKHMYKFSEYYGMYDTYNVMKKDTDPINNSIDKDRTVDNPTE
jgi:hypothetical protein